MDVAVIVAVAVAVTLTLTLTLTLTAFWHHDHIFLSNDVFPVFLFFPAQQGNVNLDDDLLASFPVSAPLPLA